MLEKVNVQVKELLTKVSAREICRRSGVSYRQICRWKTGANLSLDNLSKMCETYGFDLNINIAKPEAKRANKISVMEQNASDYIREFTANYSAHEIHDMSGVPYKRILKWKKGGFLPIEDMRSVSDATNIDFRMIVNEKTTFSADETLKNINDWCRKQITNCKQTEVSLKTGIAQSRISFFMRGVNLPVEQIIIIAEKYLNKRHEIRFY